VTAVIHYFADSKGCWGTFVAVSVSQLFVAFPQIILDLFPPLFQDSSITPFREQLTDFPTITKHMVGAEK
jgi:hypothetical protein